MQHIHRHAQRHHLSIREGSTMAPRDTSTKTTPLDRSRVLLAPREDSTDSGGTKPTNVSSAAIAVPLMRNNKKLMKEDADEKYKSLDFGMEQGPGKKNKKGGKAGELTISNEKSGHEKGLSMEMDLGSPYILPAGLHSSRESFHSLSRSMNDPNDPYRPVTFIKDDASLRSGGPRGTSARNDNGSMYTVSSNATDKDRMNNGLLKNAQRMSQSYPPRGQSMSPPGGEIPEIKFPEPAASFNSPLAPGAVLPPPPPPPVPKIERKSPPPQEQFTAFKPTEEPAPMPAVQQPAHELPKAESPPPLPRIQSQQAVVQESANITSFMSESSYGEGFKITPPSPGSKHERVMSEESHPIAPAPLRPHNEAPPATGLGVEGLDFNANRLSMSLRPLPPDDPNDNPEQRANRIRSFYKEYFDDSRPEPAGGHSYNDYVEDYGSEYLDGAVFDPHSGQFIVSQPQAPYAQPVTRRAMTPPPRAPPRFRSGSNPRGPHMSGSSAASYGRIPPRGMSSMSHRPQVPYQPRLPPTPLTSLPTPAKLDEASMLFNPADFAPPVSFRDRQNGMRPDSPLGSPRPYSPIVRAHTPLATTYDDLAVLPSPHALRKSGDWMALDFAPPGKIRDPDSGSDAGSIRSNRSGMSAAGRMAVRNGAYRVSRIPKDMVGTRDDITASLRPTLNMVAPA